MKTSKINLGVFILFMLFTINGLAIIAPAQKCEPRAQKLYFIDGNSSSGTPVKEVHPGRKYTLAVLGTNVDLYDVKKIWFMASLSVLSVDKGDARWNVEFTPNQAMNITTVPMAIKCKRSPATHWAIDPKVRLFNQ